MSTLQNLTPLSPQAFASWAEPIEMLYACHSKVKNFCRQLRMLPDYLAQHGCNQAVKNDVQQILNYFNQSAPLHHDDEEQDFFPALIAKLPEAEQAVATLESQHQALHQNWADLAKQLTELLDGARQTIDADLVQRFTDGYAEHIAIEEPLFELGRAHLPEAQLAEMGKIMADRRKR